MTCDLCFDGRHIRCRGCDCNICESRRGSASRSAVGTMGHSGNLRVYSKPKARVRDRRGEHPKYYQSPVPAEQRRLRDRLGVLTRFTPEQVERIFQAKSEGVSISELAREFSTTRDKIRTVYNCRVAPPLGERPRLIPKPKEPCPTCGRLWRPVE